MPRPTARRIEPIWEIVEQQLDEAALLWKRRERARRSPRCTLAALEAGPEERLAAHLDGVAVGGPEAVDRVIAPALGAKHPERVAAAVLALGQVPGAPMGGAVEAISQGPPERRTAAARALALTHHPQLAELFGDLLQSEDPETQAAAFAGLGLAGVAKAEAFPLLNSEAPAVRARALQAAWAWGPDAAGPVRDALSARDPRVRAAAIKSGLVLGCKGSWTTAQESVEAALRQEQDKVTRRPRPARTTPPEGHEALGSLLLVLAMSGDDAGLELLLRALEVAALRRPALLALGLTGRARAAEQCLEYMVNPELAALAGEAFSAITGLKLEGRLLAPEPKGPQEPIPFDQEELEANLVPGPEVELPNPDADEVARWWKQHRGRFSARDRYLDGVPFSAEALVRAFLAGSMRRRLALGLDLRIRSGGRFAVHPAAWAADQRRSQEANPGRPPSAWARPYSALFPSK